MQHPMASEGDQTIERLRAEIASVDEQIVTAANRRVELVREIRRHKEEHGVAFVDPDQERRNLEALESKNGGPLSSEGLRELYASVLDVTKRESASG